MTLVIGGCLTLPLPAQAGETPAPVPTSPNAPASIDLVEHPKTWDGQTIRFRGEAIGEAMVRGESAWLHLNDDGYYLRNVEEGASLAGYNSGMAVYLPARLAREVRFFGDYRHQGDIVEVRGVFNAACAQHGGDMDIHADVLRVVARGRRAIDPVQGWKIILAVGLALLALALWLAERRASTSVARTVTRVRA